MEEVRGWRKVSFAAKLVLSALGHASTSPTTYIPLLPPQYVFIAPQRPYTPSPSVYNSLQPHSTHPANKPLHGPVPQPPTAAASTTPCKPSSNTQPNSAHT